MPTNNAIDSNLPIEISKGGTNSTSMVTNFGTIYYDSSSIATVASTGTSNQILKSNGVGVAPSFKSPSSAPAVTVAFSANLLSNITNVTGDGTIYTVVWDNEVYDIGSDFDTSTGTFTAPSTSKYFLLSCVNIKGSAINLGYDEMISTTSEDFMYVGCLKDERNIEPGNTFEDSVAKVLSVFAAMDSGDTAIVKATSYDSASADNDILATSASYFCGFEPV